MPSRLLRLAGCSEPSVNQSTGSVPWGPQGGGPLLGVWPEQGAMELFRTPLLGPNLDQEGRLHPSLQPTGSNEAFHGSMGLEVAVPTAPPNVSGTHSHVHSTALPSFPSVGRPGQPLDNAPNAGFPFRPDWKSPSSAETHF